MTSKRRREQQAFNLQRHHASLDGQSTPVSSADAGSLRPQSSGSASVTQDGSLGKIEVSHRAIAHLASQAAQQSYGMVGLASRNARPGWAELLRREDEYKGVEVKFSDGRVIIDLYVVIEYGTRISEVARNIMSSVKFAVESALGVPVVQVNVNVQNIRLSS